MDYTIDVRCHQHCSQYVLIYGFMQLKNVKSITTFLFNKKNDIREKPAYLQYYKNGNMQKMIHYVNGKIHCENRPAIMCYNINGKLRAEYYLSHNQLNRSNGASVIIYTRDLLIKKYYMKNKLHRTCGEPSIEIFYKQTMHPKEIRYYSNGFLSFPNKINEYHCNNNYLPNLLSFISPNARYSTANYYINNSLDTLRSFDNNNKLTNLLKFNIYGNLIRIEWESSKIEFEDLKIPNKLLLLSQITSNDLMHGEVVYKTNNVQLPEFRYKNKLNNIILTYHENKIIKQKFCFNIVNSRMILHNSNNPAYEEYYMNGQQKKSIYIINGKIENVIKEWDINGKLLLEMHYKNNKKSRIGNPAVIFYLNNDINHVQYYVNGKKKKNMFYKQLSIMDNCPICLENSTQVLLFCKHTICKHCVKQLILYHNIITCPLCRCVLLN